MHTSKTRVFKIELVYAEKNILKYYSIYKIRFKKIKLNIVQHLK